MLFLVFVFAICNFPEKGLPNWYIVWFTFLENNFIVLLERICNSFLQNMFLDLMFKFCVVSVLIESICPNGRGSRFFAS